MSSKTFVIVDAQGARGALRSDPAAAEGRHLDVEVQGGRSIRIPRERVVEGPDGTYRFEGSFDEAAATDAEVRLPLAREELEVGRRRHETGRVRLHKRVVEHTEHVDEPVLHDEVQVERIEKGEVLTEPAETRQEGDTLIIPVMEERLVLTRQWVLKEEIHVRRHRRETRQTEDVTLRREEVDVERTDLSEPSEE